MHVKTTQLHGLAFEEAVLLSIGIEKPKGRPTDIFDIPLVTTTKVGGSLKLSQASPSIGRSTVYLSDASRVWAWPQLINMHATNFVTYPTIRLIAGFYAQVTSAEKQVQAVYDLSLVLSPDVQAQLYGDVTAEEVFAFHWGIRQEFYPAHEEARAWATQILD